MAPTAVPAQPSKPSKIVPKIGKEKKCKIETITNRLHTAKLRSPRGSGRSSTSKSNSIANFQIMHASPELDKAK